MNLNKIVIYAEALLCMSGIFLIFRTKIFMLMKSLLILPRLPQNGGKMRKHAAALMKLDNHLHQIFSVVSNGKNVERKINAFLILSVAIFILAACFGKKLAEFGIVIAAFMAFMPYGYIRLRLSMKQVKGSFEGQMLLDEIVNQYKICGFDIYMTIDKCVANLPEKSLSKKALFQFAIKMRTYVGDEELKQALKDFAANFNTIWARMLADNFYNAIRENVNVLRGFEDLLEKCKDIDQFMELSKKEGREADTLIKVLCPVTFIGLIFISKSMMGFSWNKIFSYQFTEITGIFIFSLIILTACVNIIVLPLLYKRKYDL